MKVLVTGASGFIGKNLIIRLIEEGIEYETFVRNDSIDDLSKRIIECDFIVHLAGINRPKNEIEFLNGNTDLSRTLSSLIQDLGLKIPIIYASSIQASLNNSYGVSKKVSEDLFVSLSKNNGNPVFNYRLANIFGKWCKPNYNSAVATFCFNIINDKPVQVNDPNAIINLTYIDDVVNEFISIIKNRETGRNTINLEPLHIAKVHQITVGNLVAQLLKFKYSKQTGIVERVGSDLTRALYSTYLSYLPPSQFSYDLVKHEDPRGVFVEMLKTKDSGQFSYFSAHPGVTRGGHYHHTKNEKFLVIKGQARFCFRHVVTEEYYELFTSGDTPQVVVTAPGWSHDITNVGNDELFVMLWANEIFDPESPDTINYKV
ncbi:NAD-dependent epimerase/dehydratase family protein [Vibrio splendidus]